MGVNALVIDRKAVGILDAAIIEDAWLQNFAVPENTEGLRRAAISDVVYLLSEEADVSSRYLVIDTSMLANGNRLARPRVLFERIVRVALRHFDRSITIPVQWQPYHVGALLSVYAQSNRGSAHRAYFHQSPEGSENIFAYNITDGPAELERVPVNLDLYRRAIAGVLDAALKESETLPQVGTFGVLLSKPLGVRLAGEGSLTEWYEHRLNSEQRKFVDQPNDHPVRLRGAPGTGKTQSMVVKCLRDLYASKDEETTFAFLTHSSALAHDVVRGMLSALDPSMRWSTLTTPSGNPRLWVGTLYELAQEKLGYEKKGLRPLSLDGQEGRELQRMLIVQAIGGILSDPRVALSYLTQCPDLGGMLKEATEYSPVIDDLMNEFGCVLDLENIQKGTQDADRYVRASREAWQMQLPSEAHRQLVLEIHDVYRSLLKQEKMLSMDQMVADFGRYLSMHEWAQLRERDGFNVVFVDEYHYYTRSEAMTLHNLFKSKAQVAGRWPLIMAYDLKQATSDAAISSGLEKFRNPGVGESVPVELKQVYRSTPEITAFLRDIDASFPAMDLEGEFATYAGNSKRTSGDTPTLRVFPTDTALVDAVFDLAVKAGRNIEGGGTQVAVLCLNEERFEKYCQAGRIEGKFVAVTTRDDLKELRYAKSRCVFSMPEFVAGLQFDTVFLIHADAADFSEEYHSQGARRRFVSRVYLGASRATRTVSVACSKEHGGPSSLIDGPLNNRSIRLEK